MSGMYTSLYQGLHPLLAAAATAVATPPAPAVSSPATTGSGSFPTILVSTSLLAPAVAFLLVLLFPERSADWQRRMRLATFFGVGVAAILALYAVWSQITNLSAPGTNYVFEETYHWWSGGVVPVDYQVGLDGISIPVLAVLMLILFGVALSTWKVGERVKLYCLSLLAVVFCVVGLLCSINLVLLVAFWALFLPSIAGLIWASPGLRRRDAESGGAPWRSLALRSMVAATAFPCGILLQVVLTRSGSVGPALSTLHPAIMMVAFWLTFVGAAIMVPLIPLYPLQFPSARSWLGTRMVLLAVVPSVALYLVLRVDLGLFATAAAHMHLVLALIGSLTALWAGIRAVVSSSPRAAAVSAALLLFGAVIFAFGVQTSIALTGSVFMLCGAALTVGLLTLLSAAFDERAAARRATELEAFFVHGPVFARLGLLALLSAAGVPFMSTFLGLLLIISGGLFADRILTLVLLAGFLLHVVGFARMGALQLRPGGEESVQAPDASARELAVVSPILIGMVLFGIFPGLLTEMVGNGMATILARLGG